MRFLDSNVIVHAFLRPRRNLGEAERQLKAKARRLVGKIDQGENVLTSIVHIAEVANIFGSIDNDYAYELVSRLLTKENITIMPVGRELYLLALEYARENGIGINDGVAAIVMKQKMLSQLYSFDHDFDRIAGIVRLEE